MYEISVHKIKHSSFLLIVKDFFKKIIIFIIIFQFWKYTMNHTKSAFIKLALDCQVLKFGEFTLKSGRLSPYFFNAGLFYQGNALQKLGQFYAKTLLEHQAQFEHLFGPAYKGIPLATATAV